MSKIDPPLLTARGITKRFTGVTALSDVDLTVLPGEVHAVIGENGAGKSTLMKILAGVQPPDEGSITFAGKPIKLSSVRGALEQGIALIHQELNLADNLDVGSNIFLGREPHRFFAGSGWVDSSKIHADAQRYLAMVGLDVESTRRVDTLTIGLQQLVEIAKALSINAKLLIMDEPTSSLSHGESEKLFDVIRQLRDDGVSIIYISHRLGEVADLADRVTVLRDGENAGNLTRDEVSHESMVQLMVGRDISQFYARKPRELGEERLSVVNLRTQEWPQHAVDLTVRAGEMVGIAGLVGAGRTELVEAVFGVRKPVGGHISVDGQPKQVRTCRDAIRAGIALVPEDRKQQGLILEFGVRNNIGLPGLDMHKIAHMFWNRRQEAEDSDRMTKEMNIKTADPFQPVQTLSGGNQQKVVIGKWLSMDPKVLILDEPTRGVDIGAKQEIYRLMEELAERGVAILFVSSEMEEVISMSDRVLVMHEGQFKGELTREEASEELIMTLATGNALAASAT